MFQYCQNLLSIKSRTFVGEKVILPLALGWIPNNVITMLSPCMIKTLGPFLQVKNVVVIHVPLDEIEIQ